MHSFDRPTVGREILDETDHYADNDRTIHVNEAFRGQVGNYYSVHSYLSSLLNAPRICLVVLSETLFPP